MIRRDLYLNQLRDFIDKPFIKVITGIRRSGKSMILKLLKEELRLNQINEEQIIYLNFESFEFSDIDRADKLYSYVKERVKENKRCYILLDEVQEVNS